MDIKSILLWILGTIFFVLFGVAYLTEPAVLKSWLKASVGCDTVTTLPVSEVSAGEEFIFRGNVTHVFYDDYGMPSGKLSLYGKVIGGPKDEEEDVEYHGIKNIKNFDKELKHIEGNVERKTIDADRKAGKLKTVDITMRVYERGSGYYSESLEIIKITPL